MSDPTDVQFDETPEGSAKRWIQEFKAAREALEDWHKSAEECDALYRDDAPREGQKRLNLYAASVDLKEATLYGSTPKVDVKRRNDDADDDLARVSAELLKRQLNGDLERDEEGFPRALANALKDWLIPGLGNIWLRLERETRPVAAKAAIMGTEGQEQAPAVPATTETVSEEVVSDYVYWKDQLWSPARVFSEVRWWARKALLSKRTIEEKFGKESVPLAIGADPKDSTVPKTPWARAEVWEIWDKENSCVYYWPENHIRVLVPLELKEQASPNGSIPDPLGLSTFWPFPEPLFAGLTTSKLVPRPDYSRAQDIYSAIDDETMRIGLLRDAVDASCVYDKTVGELGEMLNSKGQNKAVPAANYKELAEKGGIAACVSWKPLDMIVDAMNILRELRKEDIELLYQVDGTSDIMRGQATEGGATATEQAIKAKYGSIRGDKSQKRFATFASDAQRIRGEIICKHFSPETIKARANAQGLQEQDQPLIEQAIQMLQSDFSCYRIVVKPESVSLTDYAANKQESMDVLATVGAFVQAVGPLVQQSPAIGPGMLKLLTVFIARVKGGDAAEPILDELVKQVQQMAQQAAMQPPQPNPQLEVAKVKAQAETGAAHAKMQQTGMEMEKSQMEHQNNMQKLENEVRAEALKRALGEQGAAA